LDDAPSTEEEESARSEQNVVVLDVDVARHDAHLDASARMGDMRDYRVALEGVRGRSRAWTRVDATRCEV
jgi:hypothetical protein